MIPVGVFLNQISRFEEVYELGSGPSELESCPNSRWINENGTSVLRVVDGRGSGHVTTMAGRTAGVYINENEACAFGAESQDYVKKNDQRFSLQPGMQSKSYRYVHSCGLQRSRLVPATRNLVAPT